MILIISWPSGTINTLHLCSWFGVTCSRSNGRVATLNLHGQKLVGSIPPSIGNLTFLTEINLENNSFHGEIPQEVGSLLRLQHLNLTSNSFGGELPTNLTHCSELRTLALNHNRFTGTIPNQLSSLTKLETLAIAANTLTGSISPWMGNFSSLYKLSLARNNLHGTIPNELGQLLGLGFFQLSQNHMSGIVPPSIYNISSIYMFSVAQNQLHGNLPPDIGLTLPDLEEFYCGVNNFTGFIPVSLSNASKLRILEFGGNGLTGTIPRNLGSLRDLITMNFGRNRLGTGRIGDLSFVDSLTNISTLEVLALDGNRFGGELPISMANLSHKLRTFTIGRNLIQGSIPAGIGNIVNLNLLGMEGNQLSGSIPEVVGKLRKLQVLTLHDNRFSGLIPFSFGNLTALTRLSMDENRFEGSIPPSLGNCRKLRVLNVSCNNLNGTIPREIMTLSSISISSSLNSLSGSIPVEVGKLIHIVELNLADNRLSREIPSSLGSCVSLGHLYLGGNAFEGTTPLAFKSLRGVEVIDLSRNNLSGQSPDFFNKLLFLRHLNLSHNDFEGEVSEAGIFANATAFSIYEIPELNPYFKGHDMVPKELIFEIFLRLSAKDLVRFRCLSKDVCQEIDSAPFTMANLNRSKLVFYNTNYIDANSLYVADFDDEDEISKLANPLNPDGCLIRDEFEVYGSCNGLLLLKNKTSRKAYSVDEVYYRWLLLNPLTRNFNKVIPCPREESPDISDDETLFGFWYDSIGNDYKLVQIIQSGNLRYEDDVEIWVFSFASNTWGKQTVPFCSNMFPQQYDNSGVFAYGSLHWLSQAITPSTQTQEIVTLDLTNEEFVHLIDSPSLNCRHRTCYLGSLLVIEGSLALMMREFQEFEYQQQIELYSAVKHEEEDYYVWTKLYNVILLLWMSSCLESAIPTFANESDRVVLNDFKSQVTQDPLNIMASWNNSVHFCSWFGVSCSPLNGRVVILNLEAQKLVGSIPPSIGNLTFLTGINLENNNFHGEIPQEVGRLLRLQHLNLSINSFQGKIPTNLTHCRELRTLSLAYNGFIGKVPNQFTSLSKLRLLELGANNLTGKIPTWIGNFSSLFGLTLSNNNFQGTIPDELGQLSGLGFFQLSGNYLSGIVPPSIYNISSIYFFSVTKNQLQGHLPSDVGVTLPNLKKFYVALNNFTGAIPATLSNASRLQMLDLGGNGLTGTIPRSLGSLGNLIKLGFENNSLGTGKVGDLTFFDSLTNISTLEGLGLAMNNFGGQLPSSIANLSNKLKIFTIGGNLVHGSIPVGIGNLVNLRVLGMEANYLSGTVPEVVGNLQNLNVLSLSDNEFSGLVPFSLGNLTALTELFIGDNRFEGSIPPSLGNCQNLLQLDVSSNNLSGTIPREIMSISSLSISLSLSNNNLSGSIPVEVGKLNNLGMLDLAENILSGEIPNSLSTCVSLERLYLEGNAFEGIFPLALKSLRGVAEIDLSRNNLSGQIPDFLSKLLILNRLNLSYNDFEGEVPQAGIFADASAFSVIGNNKLCGGVQNLHLPTCTRKSHGRHLGPKVVIPVTIAVIFVLLCSLSSCYLLRRSKSHSNALYEEWQSHLSYSDVVKSTNGFSEENLIGSGSFGSVYRGKFSHDETVVAIKVLNLQQKGAARSFIDECNALRSVRHRNLLKIITACSTIDHQGNDFKCLVFEFMPNGNLNQWLHPEANEQFQNRKLSLVQRLNIAIDIASALDYLHHQCETPMVHCDLKPSNVLLDEHMTAHVGDFGLARFLFDSFDNPSSNIHSLSVQLKGSIGYIPPEYGIGGQASIYGDIYSYGILLLEMFTGKSPTDDMFKEDQSLHNFVEAALAEHAMDVVDLSMLSEEDNIEEETKESAMKVEEFVVPVMKIGLSCSAKLPVERMIVTVVVNKLTDIKDRFLKLKRNNKRMIRKH
ncbi:hypothetical protein CCACVL1_01784 [Corchorus capsularis]|uniref:non-specific serine/threonine protein kinase n=1 Tax=Corchorus capsularis TaxID=210143 RepID=A0A1R3KFQ5_COCAP|nr:hypothetical protein CCACVL1_01784 [Corchorus capsularis]